MTGPSGDVVIVIPARAASQRFPGKPLVALTGQNGVTRPLIEWTWRAACRALPSDQVIVATDDLAIAAAARNAGARVAMTDPACRNGTERCAGVAATLADRARLIVNLQGDAPLVPPAMIDALIEAWRDGGGPVLTPAVPGDPSRIVADYRAGIASDVSVATRSDGHALYFSRAPIPHRAVRARIHVGLYAYTPGALAAYVAAPPSDAERTEGLEQLRFLDMGVPVRIVDCPAPPGGLPEVNNPVDVARVAALLPPD